MSTKRKNPEFVGEHVSEAVPGTVYEALTLDVDPPRAGGELPPEWHDAVADVADRILGVRSESAPDR